MLFNILSLFKLNSRPKSKNDTLPVEKPALTTTSSSQTFHEDKPINKSPSNKINLLTNSSDPFNTTSCNYYLEDSQKPSLLYERKETLKNTTHNAESPIPISCCRQSSTNSPLNLPFPRSGNNFLYPRPEGGCLCQPMPKNGSSPIRIDVRAIKECTCECPSAPECACPPSERRFLPVKKHCPNSRLCRSPMIRFPVGPKCRCKKCQQFGPFPVPCNPCNPCTAATKCSVGQKGCNKEIPVNVIDIKIDQDQSTVSNKETLKRQVSYNDNVEIREDAIDDLLDLFPVEDLQEDPQENPPVDIKEQVVIKNNQEKVKSCPEGCGARCLVKCGLINVSKEMIKGIEKIKAIDGDNKEDIELRRVGDGKDCRRQRGSKLCSNDVRLEIDDDKIEIKGIDIDKEMIKGTNWDNKEIQLTIDGGATEEINMSEEVSDRKGCRERCGAKCNSKDVRLNHNSNDKIKIQVMDAADKKVKLESLYEDKASRNKCEGSCGNKYASDVSKKFFAVDKLPIVNKSTGKCKSKCLERYIEKKGSKNDFLIKERNQENQEIEEFEKREKDGENLESDQWTFVDVEYKRPIKLLKAIDEKKNRNERNCDLYC